MEDKNNDAGIIVTGEFLDFNGQSTVPDAMFGVHSCPVSPEDAEKYGIESVRTITQKVDGTPVVPGSSSEVPSNVKEIIDCIYDRYQPALILEHGDWKERLETSAAKFAENRKKTGYPQTIEFWNEPYLNWACKPAVNYDPVWFREEESNGRKILKIRSTGETTDLLEWTEQMLAVGKNSGQVNYLASRYALDYRNMGKYQDGQDWKPFKWEDGFEFKFRGSDLVLKNVKWLKDKTQKSYYSSEFNSHLYVRMLLAFGLELKKKCPEIKLVAGWDCNIWWDDWEPWKKLFKPIIDEAHGIIDGIDEHHYGCDTRMIGAEYEVVSTYAMSRYGKSIRMYNTEAGGAVDPEQPGKYQPDGSSSGPIGNFIYMVRDVVHLISLFPDKAAARAFHQPQNSPGGLDSFLFLKELRGRFLNVKSEVPGVWTVASIRNGTICLLVFNDNSRTVEIPLASNPPAGCLFKSGTKVTPAAGTGGKIEFRREPLDFSPGGKSFEGKISLPAMSAVKYLFNIDGAELEGGDMVHRRQFCASDILSRIRAGEKKSMEVILDRDFLSSADFAKLRIVHNRIDPENAELVINGERIAFNIGNECWTSEIPVPVGILKEKNNIEIKGSGSKEILVCAAGIVLFKREKMKTAGD